MYKSHVPKLIVSVFALTLCGAVSTVQAADTSSNSVIRAFRVTVPPAQDHAFRQGMKQWIKCLRSHGDTLALYAYDEETDNLSNYSFLEPHATWAQLGMHNPAGKACRETFRHSVMPHFTGAGSVIFERDKKGSYDPGESPPTTPLWWALYFNIKPGHYHAFIAWAHAIGAAAAKTHWDQHFIGYHVEAGGPGSPQYMVVFPNQSWGDFGESPHPSLRKMVDGVYGKAVTDSLMHNQFHALRDESSIIWSYDKALSLVPSKG